MVIDKDFVDSLDENTLAEINDKGMHWLIESIPGEESISEEEMTATIENPSETPEWLTRDLNSSTEDLENVKSSDADALRESLRFDMQTYLERYQRRVAQLENLKATDPKLQSLEAVRIVSGMKAIQAKCYQYLQATDLVNAGKVDEAKAILNKSSKPSTISRLIKGLARV